MSVDVLEIKNIISKAGKACRIYIIKFSELENALRPVSWRPAQQLRLEEVYTDLNVETSF